MAGNSVRFTATIDDKVSGKLGIIGQKFDKTFGKNSAASLFGNVGAKAVATGFNLIGDAIGGTLGFLEDSVKAFNEDAQAQALLEQALQNNIQGWRFSQQAVNDYIDAQIELGFVDDDVRASISQLVGITHDATRATELNTLAENLARAKSIDLAQATDIVTKAAQGNGKALKALGIDVGKTKDAAGLLDLIQKNVKGSADAWANTTSGKLQIAQDKFAESQEKLGGMIMPVLTAAMTKLVNDWLPALGRGWDKVTKAMQPVLKVLGLIIGKIADLIGWVSKAITKLGDLAQITVPAIPGLPFPHFATGGLVPGPVGQPTMAVVHGGERVLRSGSAPSGGGGTGVTIVGVSASDIARIVDEHLFIQLRRAAPTAGRV